MPVFFVFSYTTIGAIDHHLALSRYQHEHVNSVIEIFILCNYIILQLLCSSVYRHHRLFPFLELFRVKHYG